MYYLHINLFVRQDFIDGILQAGAPFGSCKNVAVPRSPPTNNMGTFTGSVQFSSSASTVYSPNCLLFKLSYLSLMVFLLLLR